MSLRLRLVLALAPLFILGVVIADVVTYTTLHGSLLSQLDSELGQVRPTVQDAFFGGPFGGGPRGMGPSVPPGTFGGVLTSSGALAAPTIDYGPAGQVSSAAPQLPADAVDRVGQDFDAPGSGGVSSYRVLVSPVDNTSDVLVVALPEDNLNSTLGQVFLLELVVTLGLTAFVALSSWLIVRRGLQPLERMAATARSIAATDLSKRVEPSTEHTEVGRLGIAINGMLTQLEAAFLERARNEARLRHFISDASHELRTPLTSMQGYAELLQREMHMDPADVQLATRRIEEETLRMSVLVDDLLLLARLDQGRPLQRETVDLEALVQDAAADARVADPGRAITTQIAAPLEVTGDEMRLRQVLGNLVRNALVHTPAGTPVEIALRPEAGRAVIEVVDHGRGVPAEQRARIFERFQRSAAELSRDRGGSGLGLSIVAAVVNAHGGAVRVLDTPGGGATFRVELPLFDAVPLAPPEPSPPPPPAP